MTNKRRDLMLRLADGDQRTFVILYHLDRLTRCDEVLSWLIRHHLTGKALVEWMENIHERSILKMASAVLQRIDKDLAPRPILAGKDYRI